MSLPLKTSTTPAGALSQARRNARGGRFVLDAVANPDPNTFDRTLVTVQSGKARFTFRFDDLEQGPLLVWHFGVAVLPDNDRRDYATVAAEQKVLGAKTLYDRIAAMPEQTWRAAWAGMPRKKSDICFPLGLDGGRQRFRLNADGSLEWRSNDHYLKARPGKDTPRLALEPADMSVGFGLPSRPVHRTLEEESLPVCITAWDVDGVRVEQTAFVTTLAGTQADGPTPAGDAFTVWMARVTLTNTTPEPKPVALPLNFKAGGQVLGLRSDADGLLWSGENGRAQVTADNAPTVENGKVGWAWTLTPHESRIVTLKIPYVVLSEPAEREALKKLDFDAERKAVAGYWHRRLNESARLITPEPMLNEFYRSHAMHLLVNCEREPREILQPGTSRAESDGISRGEPGSLSTQMRPPINSASRLQMASPRPVPPKWRAAEAATC